MSVEIRIGPPVITINQGSTFMVTDERGEIDPESEQGVFTGDTRFVSFYQLYINGARWQLLSSSAVSYYASRCYFTNPTVATEDGDISGQRLGLRVTRTIGDGIHEDLDITNYALDPVRFILEIALRADFADLFEVKSHKLVRRGRVVTQWDDAKSELINDYAHEDFKRRLVYKVHRASSPPQYSNGRISFEVRLQPGESWHTCALYGLGEADRTLEPVYGCDAVQGSDTRLDELQAQWRELSTQLTSANEDVYRAYTQALEDIGALRIYDLKFASDVWLPAAGVPWFVTIFGRDSLIVSLQSMMVHAPLALGAIEKLAQYQAEEIDDYRDAEPGKILHELRCGELAHFKKIPHTPYYGTADATILYLITLHEAWKWLGDSSILHKYRQVAMKCLEWIDRYGDLDGDGFQEYKTRSSVGYGLGYENMGWKDAGNAVVYPDGSQVKQPKALCELQGYVFDAKMRMAEVFDALGETGRAATLRGQALELQRRFDQAFWMEDEGFIAFGLDPEKRPIRTIASNAGHCLWSGIVRPERAERIVRRFFEEDMRSGWGIRTLSSKNPAYNPFEYQLGSVWPHDNGIIAMGFKRYGFHEEASRVARDIFEAASYFDGYRLPELYTGLPRERGTFPVQYLGANIPQAWAAGCVFHLLQAILGIQADAPAGRLYVAPTLPRWLPEIEMSGIKVGDSVIRLRFWLDGQDSRWEVLDRQGSIEVHDAPAKES